MRLSLTIRKLPPRPDAFRVSLATIPVGNRVWGIALDPSGTKLYIANGAPNDISVVDVKLRKELRRIKAGDGPWGIAIVPTKEASAAVHKD